MDRRSFLVGLAGVVASGTLVYSTTLPSLALPVPGGIEPLPPVPTDDKPTLPDGTPVEEAQDRYWRGRDRRWHRRNRRWYRRNRRWDRRHYRRWHRSHWGRRRVCRFYRDRWGNRRRRCH